MQFTVEIEHVQPILSLRFTVDLAEPGIVCIAGKNGAGKTTLARALMNFSQADTFTRTAAHGIFGPGSVIRYTLDETPYEFRYDQALRTIDTRVPVPASLKKLVSVELPMPHGQRFHFFMTLFNADHDIRSKIVLGQYERPERLIEFLSNIYGERRFDDLIAVRFRHGMCCCILREDGWYLREDYFSSGEYFLINLFKKITEGKRLVFIDEIDISLDASAQARLASALRVLCREFDTKLVFTSHSLAIMQTLQAGELMYLERGETGATLTPMSFSFVKSLMFGFRGYDRFIITEDDVLKGFLEYVIQRYCRPAFFSYVIIIAGSGAQAVEMMRRNRRSEFLGPTAHVITILDGDQRRDDAAHGEYCVPIANVEAVLHQAYQQSDFPMRVVGGHELGPKPLYKRLIRDKAMSAAEIYGAVCDRAEDAMREFAGLLSRILGREG
jgi:hypothetical protein